MFSLKFLSLLLFLSISINCSSQKLISSDIIKGGITFDGFGAYGQNASGTFNVSIPPNSTIKNALLICINYNLNIPNEIIFNNTNYNINPNNTDNLETTAHIVNYGDITLTKSIINVSNNVVSSVNSYQIEVTNSKFDQLEFTGHFF